MTAAGAYGEGPSVLAIAAALACGGRCCARALANGTGRVHCPVHDGAATGDPDLDVKPGDRQAVVFTCRVGCDQNAIIAELQARGLWPQPKRGEVVPLRPARSDGRRRVLAERGVKDLCGADGQILARHVREDYTDGKKSFYWQHPDGRMGMPDGLSPSDLLYGAELLPSLPDGTTVVLCEGQKATDACRDAGLLAVGTVTSASGTLSDVVLATLRRFVVVLWADNDEAGRGHMGRHAERLRAMGSAVRWVDWAGAPAKGDAADATPGERSLLVEDAPVFDPKFLSAGTSISIEPAETIPLFVSAREFAATTPEQPEWIAAPYVARGSITEIAGKLKASGKTTWLLAMCRKVLDGLPFMGYPTSQTGVIYLTEQAGTSFRAGLARADLLNRDDFLVLFWHRARGMEWSLIVQAAVTEAKRRGYALIVVDTLPQFSGISGDSENSSGAALDAMKPLQEATSEDLAVVVSRHERKGGGDVGESGRGSLAYSGAVDIVASIRRGEGQSRETLRVIHALGRFDDTPSELVIELVDGEYQALGTGHDVKAQEAKTLLLEQLPHGEDEAVTVKEIADALAEAKVKRTTILQALAELEAAGGVQRVGEGKRGSPFRYWKSTQNLSAGAPVVPAESIPDDGFVFDEEV